MDNIFCKSKIKKEVIILDLVCLNLIQIILTFTIILLMTSCAPFDGSETEWRKSLVKIPKLEGFINAGFFSMNDSIYSQHCDMHGNQIWMKWDENKELWSKKKYTTHGCSDYESATGPDA